jgi:hypothetical protein
MTPQERADKFHSKNPQYSRDKYLERKEQYRLGILTKKKESNETSKKRYKKHINTLSDYYVTRRLVTSGFEKNDITLELIELKRQQIILKRLLNEKLQ